MNGVKIVLMTRLLQLGVDERVIVAVRLLGLLRLAASRTAGARLRNSKQPQMRLARAISLVRLPRKTKIKGHQMVTFHFWLNPHEVIQSRDSIEVGASGLYWVLDRIATRRINLVGALA